MIWIHGGGFTAGEGTTADGSRLSLKGDVIIVTINYRLNIFGFFSTGSHNFRGNYGLYDQQMAIRWVKENIIFFGGDPSRITLFGLSAGGVSTTLQSIIPSNKGLFLRVIGESGSFLARRDYQTKTYSTSNAVTKLLNCSRSSELESIECLRAIPAKNLLNAFGSIEHPKVRDSYTLTTSIGPITDGELIPDVPEVALQNRNSDMYKQYISVDLLVGTNSADSVLLYFNLKPYQQKFNFNVSEGIQRTIVCDNMAPTIVKEIFNITCVKMVDAICKRYTSDASNNDPLIQSQMAANLYGDFFEDVPTVKSLDVHTASSHGTYQYFFSRRPDWEVISERPKWLVGANHASEKPFVFGLESFYPANFNITDEERLLSEKMMSYWTNFARSGNPNGKSLETWPAYTNKSKQYIIFDRNVTSGTLLHGNRMKFWLNDVSAMVADCTRSATITTTASHSGTNGSEIPNMTSLFLTLQMTLIYLVTSLLLY